MKNARVLVGLVLGLMWVGCAGEGEPEIEVVQAALITNGKVNVGGPAVADTGGTGVAGGAGGRGGAGGTGGAAGSFASDPMAGGTIITTTHAIAVAGVTFAAPQAVYQNARLGTFTYTATGFPANAPVAVRLHFAEISTTIGNGQRLVNVAIGGVNVVSGLDIFKTAGGAFRAIVQQVAGKANAAGSVTITVSGASGTQGLLSGYEVWVIDCGPPSAPVGGTVTDTKTVVGGVATYHCPTTDVLVGNTNRTCTQFGAAGSWTPAAPVCLIKQGQTCGSSNACASGFCVGGVCCQSACNGTCDGNTCAGGLCEHASKQGTACGTRRLNEPSYNDIQLRCDATGACKGPQISCGGQSGCDLGTNVCCMTSDPGADVVISCTPNQFQCQCGAGGNCSPTGDQRWYGCKSNADCPNGMVCSAYFNYFGDYGIQYTACFVPGTWPGGGDQFNGNTVCDPTNPANQCPTGQMCTANGETGYCS